MVHDKSADAGRNGLGRFSAVGATDGTSELVENKPLVGVDSCSACGEKMRYMGHCKYWCLACGFQLTCNDTL